MKPARTPDFPLLDQAKIARDRSHSPYTQQKIGAAVRSDLGIHLGATLENCAYPNCLCAVQAALVNAVSSGAQRIMGLAVVVPSDSVEPCGRCVQFAAEFGDFPVSIQVDQITNTFSSIRELLRPTMKAPITQFMTGRCIDFGLGHFGDYRLKPVLAVDMCGLTEPVFTRLVKSAVSACQHCYVPTSNFPVGAAILTDKGNIVPGANIECHCLGLGICGERCAMCNMVSLDAGRPVALAVVCAKLPDYGRPCGGCRQNLVEFGEYPVFQLMLDHTNKTIDVEPTTTLRELPSAFTPSCL
eukprot:Gregarina_sp_Poly_1__51@NODE_100_length_14458_cov_232_622472_g87_i0_p8_GENE_NODE_100_length_14458_cov_232_622472_g87_i0NODE_100_length_14458_cov_232_622472_g87_i0_p8_ORF_typecomplete_len299_score23_11dCMP_cyt_deam_2/PF08211_12/1_3e13dCMP_cyt_deam_2/PF08211_12/2_9e14dCMP_cyt_deam_1/PF00383_23/5_6e10dCMP_cyt_deam_1/PF00383_23/2_1e10_NODE_100_length_14458_cov_232_622472_g87_i015002396